MSRLRRPFLYEHYIFVTVDLLKLRTRLKEPDYERVAQSVKRMRERHGLFLTAWVFLPDHWHAIFYPPYPLTISTASAKRRTLATSHFRPCLAHGEGIL
jgi:REP element-mobilizing transposase RayT